MALNSISKQDSYGHGHHDIEPVAKPRYKFYPVNGCQENIEVKASSDVKIALTSDPEPKASAPITEIIIGGWNNTKSVILRNNKEKTKNETKDILNDQEFCGFWVRWNGSTISVGCKEDPNAFLSWTDPEPFPINFIGVSERLWLESEKRPSYDVPSVGTGRILGLETSDDIQRRYSEMYVESSTKHVDVETNNNLQYKFYPRTGCLMNFEVRAPHDAHIALSPDPRASVPITEIIIGGWDNTKSVIRRDGAKPEKAENQTNNILNANEFRGFWLRWNSNGNISVGNQGDSNAFLSWTDPDLFPIYYVGVCTGWGAAGSWKIQVPESYGTWVDATEGYVPSDAVVGGQDHTGELIYVARARHDGGATLPGKLITSHGCAIVPCSQLEHKKPKYQVLLGGPNNWVPTSGSNVPPGAFPGGKSEEGEPLFIGRVHHRGSTITGKVHRSHGVCYICFGGREVGFSEYEVLTH